MSDASLFPPTAPPPRPVAPGLYLVATPIGNLRDITLRALDVLAAADLVLAEDTRVTARLLAAYGINKKLVRYDDHIGENVHTRDEPPYAWARQHILAAMHRRGESRESEPSETGAL